jgi:hypothetical protein
MARGRQPFRNSTMNNINLGRNSPADDWRDNLLQLTQTAATGLKKTGRC